MDARKALSILKPGWKMVDQPLSVQFVITGGIVAAFSIISLGILLYQVSHQIAASRWLSQTHMTLNHLKTLGQNYYRQQASMHEYLKTADNRFLAVTREARQLWEEDVSTITGLISDDPKQVILLHNITEGYSGWFRLADELIHKAGDSVQSNGGRPTRPDRQSLMEESASFKQTFLVIEKMIDWENNQLKVWNQTEKNATQSTFIAIAIINIALLLIFSVALAKLFITIARPISDLSSGIKKYQEGDFKARVQVSNKSEIGFLEASFNEMAEKIEAMVTDLRKLDELKTEFLSTVSHELRTPLTSIGGYTKLLAEGDTGEINETQKEFLGIIDTNVVRLTNLINDILDIEKMESGKIQLGREPQDLGMILKECRDTFEVVARQKGLQLLFNPSGTPLMMIGDHDRLVQVFMNLLSNSIKYTKQGHVEISSELKGYAIVVRVTDTGIGLTKEDQEKLFQKFYRTRSGIATGEGGTGLGLVIMRKLVEAHSGSIKVESEPGKGTTFQITFPAMAPTQDGIDKRRLARESKKQIIWIISPDENEKLRCKKIISDAGSALSGAATGTRDFDGVHMMPTDEQGLEAPGLVILSVNTETEGLTALSSVRQNLHQTVPIILLGPPSVDAKTAFAQGASACIQKPVTREILLLAVKDLLARNWWRILVADSNTDLRLLIKRALEHRGFKVDDVDRGNLVLGRLEQEHYDLALLDTHLPDISSIELVKIMRKTPRFISLPVLLMSVEDQMAPNEAEISGWGNTALVAKYKGLGQIVEHVYKFLETRKAEKK
ncbi:MAG: hypothetical protein A2583_07275 [Bdellovibrionales bacterium RIFOXYD1_FULL_53_11]|nr:MAG: hypothetical protein A2583_07275 [Bdellovibrionales bacterium RIFOXYD1_FULL_53_11]